MSIIIRRANINDLNVIRRIEIECFGNEAFTKTYLAYLMTAPNTIFLVAEMKGEIAGFIVGSVDPYRKGGLAGHIYSLDVSPRYRRRGIGSTLLSEIEKIFKKTGVEICYLEVRIDNVAAKKLYRKHDYKETVTLKDYYRLGVHGVRLQKRINPSER